jgi:hypothetical protein
MTQVLDDKISIKILGYESDTYKEYKKVCLELQLGQRQT